MNKYTLDAQSVPWAPPRPMTEKEFKELGTFIQTEFGIKMPPGKKSMLESRLNKRLRSLGMTSYKQYKDYLFSLKGLEIEMPHLMDAVTTNKTEFFREDKHFEVLAQEVLPAWLAEQGRGKPFMVWSAGCSTGEEVYSLAMVLAEFAASNRGFGFEVLGTDISQEVLHKAKRGVYPERLSQGIPQDFCKKYLMRSTDRSKGLMRIVPELRSKVAFRELNLIEDFSFREKMDVVFCRNVVIYFEWRVQEILFQKLCSCIAKGGFLFIGHSESLSGMDLPLEQSRPTVFKKL